MAEAVLRAAPETVATKAKGAVRTALSGIGLDKYEANKYAARITSALELLTRLGDVAQFQDNLRTASEADSIRGRIAPALGNAFIAATAPLAMIPGSRVPLRSAESAVKRAAEGLIGETAPRAAAAVPAQTVNVGLDRTSVLGPGAPALGGSQVKAALGGLGVKPTKLRIHPSDTEPTAVVNLPRPLSPAELDQLSRNLDQEAVAALTGSRLDLHGPKADKWGPGNPSYFLTLDGRRLDDPSIDPAAYLPDPGQRLGNSKLVSARTPSKANWEAEGDPNEVYLGQTMDAFWRSTGNHATIEKQLLALPFMSDMAGKPFEQIVSTAVRRGADNLKYIIENGGTLQQIEKARDWYVTANGIAKTMATKNNLPVEAASGVIAALSPRNEWSNNVIMAERLAEMHGDKFDIGKLDMGKLQRWIDDPKGAPASIKAVGADYMARIMNSPFEELGSDDRLRRITATDAMRNDTQIPTILADGTRDFSKTKKISWGLTNYLDNALDILDNPNMSMVRQKVGGTAKVPYFYNSIMHPKKADGAVMDTHSAGNWILEPVSSNDPIADQVMAGAVSAKTGSRGLNPLAVESHTLAAQELGFLPTEVQSITWDLIRPIWGAGGKTDAVRKGVEDAWRKNAGNPDAARKEIRKLANFPTSRR